MALISIISALSTFVPAISGWLGGDKAESIAQKVADVAMSVTGLKDPKAAAAQIAADGQSQIAFKLEMDKQHASFEEMYLKDKQQAREAQANIAINSKSKKAREFIYNYAWFVTVAAFLYIACITFLEIPEANQRFADTILGFALGTLISSIIQFFFGASKPVSEHD